MHSDKVFQIALLVSLAAHGVILLSNPQLNLPLPFKDKKETKMEVSYLKELTPPKEEARPQPAREESQMKLPARPNAARMPPPPFIDIDKEAIFKKTREANPEKQVFNKPKPAELKPDIIAVKKKITLPALDIDKIDNPSYISYYQIVREKIRRCAYQNYARSETGEVYLSFIVFSDGTLGQMRLVEEKSSASPYLRDIAARSIKEASPFPNFPKELDYPQLSFNVVISFEIE